MRVLLLGGSWFLGRTVAREALARGWQVTAFTRGRTGSPPAGVEHVRGDRHDLDALRRLRRLGPWDATVDTSAYEPTDVADVVNVLGAQGGRYVLVSTVSAYQSWPDAPVDESSDLWPSRLDARASDPDVAALSPSPRYGMLKAGCELAASTAPDGALIVRPGVILGPGEYVGRALKLLDRARRGGRWLVPGPPEQPIQPVDVRDVAAFVLGSVAAGAAGAFNLTAPDGYATYEDLIAACVALTGHRATPVWADPQWLTQQGVKQWTEMPLWRTSAGTWAVDSRRAHRAGFVCRPLQQTLADFQAAVEIEPLTDHPRAAEHGMAPDRETSLLAAWDAQPDSPSR